MSEHICDSDGRICDGDWHDCIRGTIYGPCEHDSCGSVCEPVDDCKCECRKEQH